MKLFKDLADEAAAGGLECLVIGGYAVILHGYDRVTADIDLLVSDEHRTEWRTWFNNRGYTILNETKSFIQLTPTEGAVPVDLMVVTPQTFQKLSSERVSKKIAGVEAMLPKALHIVAIKVHSAISPTRHDKSKDWVDILHLIQICNLDVHSTEFRTTVVRYGGEATYERILRDQLPS